MRHAEFCIGIKDRKFNLLFRRVQVDKQIIHIIDDFINPGVVAINFINDEDDGQFFRQGFFHDETRLWQWSLAGINQEHGAIHHVE